MDDFCRVCEDRHYETMMHVLHQCHALDEPRQLLYREVQNDVPSLLRAERIRKHILRDAPLHAAKSAMAKFTNEHFNWTRRHMLEYVLDTATP
jgi:hypothetical protein